MVPTHPCGTVASSSAPWMKLDLRLRRNAGRWRRDLARRRLHRRDGGSLDDRGPARRASCNRGEYHQPRAPGRVPRPAILSAANENVCSVKIRASPVRKACRDSDKARLAAVDWLATVPSALTMQSLRVASHIHLRTARPSRREPRELCSGSDSVGWLACHAPSRSQRRGSTLRQTWTEDARNRTPRGQRRDGACARGRR